MVHPCIAVSPRAALTVAGVVILVTSAGAPALAQQTFNNANSLQLNNVICGSHAGTGLAGLGPNLAAICARRAAAGGAFVNITGPGVISAVPPSTEQRQRRQGEEIAEAEEKGSGGSADVQRFGLFGDTTLALSTGADAIVHPNNPYEVTYHGSTAWMTVAIGTRPVSWLAYGVGFTYQHVTGHFADGGGFLMDTYRPFLLASLTPTDGVFIDANLAYARIGNTGNRPASATLSSVASSLAGGIATGTPEENGYTGSILAGYDQQFGNLTIGPRLGFNAGYWNVDGYQESGTTGLELHYKSADQTSLQSTLGGAASIVVPTTFGAVLSTITASWVHEFEAYPHLIYAQFGQAPGSPFFTFSTQKPAADFGVLGIRLSAVLPGGARPYASFGTIMGNGVYQSYGGMVGVTFGL
jgi:hypothetical protein